MLEKVQEDYDGLRKLSQWSITQMLINQLDQQLANGKGPASPYLFRANLLRRCGDLQGAKQAILRHLQETNWAGLHDIDAASVIPAAGLRSSARHLIAPLMVFDDFLPLDEMAALHGYACELEQEFCDAPTMGDEKIYDPDKRRTLVKVDFQYKRQFFLDFLEANLQRFQTALGLPEFDVEQVEIKLTNHVDGGFFRVHSDNQNGMAEAGRAFTWLYYFSELPARFEGGELFVIDSDRDAHAPSHHWFTTVKAVPNRLVAFPSCHFHAVGPTHVPSREFAAGRFAISSHVRKGADGLDWPSV